jgi:hypothetical protein
VATSPSYYGDFSDRDLPTLNTVANYIADARTLLQDVIPPYRYDDPSLLVAFNVTLLEARRLRADLFVFNLSVNGQTQAFTEVDQTYVDMEPQFRLAILHGLCGHALERDQEDVQDIRATTFLQLFNAGLIGRALGGVSGGSGPGRQSQGQGPAQ